MGKLFAILALGSASTVVSTGTGWVQYGALGLCGFMVMFLINHIKAQAKVIEKKDDEIKENNKELRRLLKDDISAKNRLAEALEDRPCICGDSRVNKN